jgi:N-acyl-D-aspartate/D-glutamate deacylase
VSEHINLILKKLDHLARMREYLRYSLTQATAIMPIQNWQNLQPSEHETLAALRVRFSEYQEHMGKTMKAIAAEEEKPTEPFTAVLLYMEKLGCIDSVQQWKQIRELRNAINHEYEEDTAILSEFFQHLAQAAPTLFQWHEQLQAFCQKTYITP